MSTPFKTCLALLALATSSLTATAQIQDRGTTCTVLPESMRSTAIHGNGKSIALYMQLAGKNRDVDDQVKTHLESLGFKVTEVDQSQPAETLNNYALVLLSSSVSARYLRYTVRDLRVPLMTWEYQMLDQLSMVGRRENVDSGIVEKEHNLWFVNAPHPVEGGIPAGKTTIYTTAAPMTWGKPGLGASIIATLPGEPEKAAIFAYEKGATMDYDFLAPARRLFFPLDDRTFPNLNPCGLNVFDAAINWTVGN